MDQRGLRFGWLLDSYLSPLATVRLSPMPHSSTEQRRVQGRRAGQRLPGQPRGFGWGARAKQPWATTRRPVTLCARRRVMRFSLGSRAQVKRRHGVLRHSLWCQRSETEPRGEVSKVALFYVSSTCYCSPVIGGFASFVSRLDATPARRRLQSRGQ